MAATISNVTKCVKRNKHNVQINLEVNPQFEQAIEFTVYREPIQCTIETSISSKSINEDKNTLVYKQNEIIDIPMKLNSNFDNMLDADYYLFGVNKTDSFFLSLMYIISKEFKLKNTNIQVNYVNTLKETIQKEINNLHKKFNYTVLGYSKNHIHSCFDNNIIDESVLCLISDYFGINLILLDYEYDKYMIGKEYDNTIDSKNIIIIKNDNYYIPLIQMYGEYPSKMIYKCVVNNYKINKKVQSVINDSVVEVETHQTKANVSNTNSIVEKENNDILSSKIKLKAFSGYKLPELRTLAQQHNISIKHENNGKPKNKSKRELYDELSNTS